MNGSPGRKIQNNVHDVKGWTGKNREDSYG